MIGAPIKSRNRRFEMEFGMREVNSGLGVYNRGHKVDLQIK